MTFKHKKDEHNLSKWYKDLKLLIILFSTFILK